MATESPPLGMRRVPLAPRTLEAYVPIVGEDVIADIQSAARPLQGARVAHISATERGGGVAEILQSLVPLMRSAGLDAEWHIISGTDAFFTITKGIHNALQGMPLVLSPEMQSTYLAVNRANASSFTNDFDFIVVHDPQPAPLRPMHGVGRGIWIWQSHIDLTMSDPAYWAFMRSFIEAYDAAIFTMAAFVPWDLSIGTVAIIPPAIDPLSQKNVPIPDEQVNRAIGAQGVDPFRPLLVQVSRYDHWKDPLGVIDVFRAVRPAVPGLQLVLLGALALDDPEGLHYYQRTLAHAEGDPDIHVLMNVGGDLEVNAFQRRASAILQKSLREGFGLTVTEGLWKARPVVAGNVGGIPLQIDDGVTGYLVGSVEQAAHRILAVFGDPAAAAEMGRRGREVVRHKFLSTANLRNYLQFFAQLRPTH
ncbi:MAG TPA: glycosyltransferase [Ktedonobacterales bacterium]|nr:glycosyltransferase [Ktedonobacterales bacterium]